MIRKHRPWEKSSGPKTDQGKARAKMNAFKHGMRDYQSRRLREGLKHQQEFVKIALEFATNELMKEQRKQEAIKKETGFYKQTERIKFKAYAAFALPKTASISFVTSSIGAMPSIWRKRPFS